MKKNKNDEKLNRWTTLKYIFLIINAIEQNKTEMSENLCLTYGRIIKK